MKVIRKFVTKALSIALAAAMVIGISPISAKADETLLST